MNEALTSRTYGIKIMADLEGALDSVWRERAIYKLYKAGITNNLLLVLTSFLQHRQYRNLVNTYTADWNYTTTGVPQGSILSPLIFIVFTADMTVEEEASIEQEPNESKYADDFNFWKTQKNFFTLLINIQLAVINIQTWFSKWQVSLNISKTNYMVYYNKKTTTTTKDTNNH